MRLGQGELTMHYRRDDGGRKIECGATHGCITSVVGDVTCKKCRAVNAITVTLAEACGCRNYGGHRAVALAIHELGCGK